jgi:hypothetical protein
MWLWLQIFNDVRWSREVDESSYEWLSDRRYKLDEIQIALSDFQDLSISFGGSVLLMSQQSDRQFAHTVIRLVEGNPHLKKLHIEAIETNYDFHSNIFRYLRQRCQEIKEIALRSNSAETVQLAMDSFPNLTTLRHYTHVRSFMPSSLDEVASYPSIENLILKFPGEYVAFIPLVKQCPNLRRLDFDGSLIDPHLHGIMVSCSKLISLNLNFSSQYVQVDNVSTLISTIAEFGLQLQELSINFLNINIQTGSKTRDDMIRILRHLRKLKLSSCHFITGNGREPVSSLCSMFSSSGVDLRALNISTFKEKPDMIAMMLHGCRNVDKLNLRGVVKISPVMMMISASCHQLVDLTLEYRGNVNGVATKALLQSCSLLRSLSLHAYIDVRVYESLALFGGNVSEIKLRGFFTNLTKSGSSSFDTSSPLYDGSFKQVRKYPMNCLDCEKSDIDVKSLVKFLSCFGVIEELFLFLASSQLPADLDNKLNNDWPAFHARRVCVRFPTATDRPIDAAFITLMNSCHSLRELSVGSFLRFARGFVVDASTLIRFACEYSQRNAPLLLLSYPRDVDLSPLKELLPKLKLIPFP